MTKNEDCFSSTNKPDRVSSSSTAYFTPSESNRPLTCRSGICKLGVQIFHEVSPMSAVTHPKQHSSLALMFVRHYSPALTLAQYGQLVLLKMATLAEARSFWTASDMMSHVCWKIIPHQQNRILHF